MRISDWSSDVCSSDLRALRYRSGGQRPQRRPQMLLGHRIDQYALTREDRREPFGRPCALAGLVDPGQRLQRDAEIEIVAVKRATEILPIAAHGQNGSTERTTRKSALSGTTGSIRVELGGGRITKK